MKKVLLIDDDPSVFLLLKDTFTKGGFSLDSAKDGQEGLQKIKEMKPDLILLDILMPTMNGFEVLDELKGNPDSAPIPVFVYSILQDEKDIETAFNKGAVGFIYKDLAKPQQVLEKIEEMIQA